MEAAQWRRVGGQSSAAHRGTRIRLQRYLLRELISSFALLLAIVTSIVGAGMLIGFLHKAPELGLLAMLKGMPFVLPEAFPITVPLAFLVACLLTYGRFADDNEFTAFRMGGIHPWHAVAPAIAFGAVLSVFAVWLSTDVLPWARLEQRQVLRDQLQAFITALEDGSKTTIETGDNFHLSAAERAPDGAFVDVVISVEATRPGRKKGDDQPGGLTGGGDLRADRAWLFFDAESDSLVIRLENARRPSEDVSFAMKENTFAIALDQLLDASPLEEDKRTSMMSAGQLTYRLERGSPRDELIWKWRAELWYRVALGLAPLAFGLLGAPLGLWSARGSRASAFLLALIVALPVFYPLLRLGSSLAESGALPAPVALLGGNVVIMIAGIVVLVRVVRT